MADCIAMTMGIGSAIQQNVVLFSGTVRDAGNSPVVRDIYVFESGTDTMVSAGASDAGGDLAIALVGDVSSTYRIEAFGDSSENENTKVFDHVNPIQHLTLL